MALPTDPYPKRPVREVRKSPFLRTAKAVLWSFVGLRTRADYEQDVDQLNPVHIVVAGLLGVVVFVGSLMLLAMWITAK
jgi:Protein of unknown function (DUF2970)